MIKKFSLYLNDENPAVAAAIRRERYHLRREARVYVKAYTRGWPGGPEAAQKAIEKAKKSSGNAMAALHALRAVKSV